MGKVGAPSSDVEKHFHEVLVPDVLAEFRSGRDDKGEGNGCIESGCRLSELQIRLAQSKNISTDTAVVGREAFSIDKKSQALRMTVLFGNLQDSWLDMREHERSKKSQPLGMTVLWRG